MGHLEFKLEKKIRWRGSYIIKIPYPLDNPARIKFPTPPPPPTHTQDGSIFASLLFSSSFDASRRAGSRDKLQSGSARRLDLTRDFGRVKLRDPLLRTKQRWPLHGPQFELVANSSATRHWALFRHISLGRVCAAR
jgi:hypothetical protein